MKRLGFVAGVVAAASVLVVACGSSPGDVSFGTGDGGADATLPDSSSLGRNDGSPNGNCHPLTCAKLGYTCGQTGDGCGNTIDCGTCTGGDTCGGGGKFSVCGGGSCPKKTCADQGIACGPAGDGCGNLLSCGSCTAPDTCGGGGTSSVCGSGFVPPDGGLDGGPCVPKTCASQGLACGPAGDGCGNLIASCGSCGAGESCGGGGVNGKCGQPPPCIPKTCGDLGFDCGPAGDGCGGLIMSCGSCTGTNICGGGAKPGVCGNMPPCTNLCLNQVVCAPGVTTTLTGQVVAGTLPMYLPTPASSPDPIPNVLVYVPNSTPDAFAKGVECAPCGADVTGSPLIQATTDAQGNFTLTNVPVPASGVVPLVIQLGRWRRIFGLGNAGNPGFHVTKCMTTNAGQIRMPRNKGEGDIPFTAISTGQIDPMECVLLKMGVDEAEFTDPGGGGRVEMYIGNGSYRDLLTPLEPTLVPDAPNATTTLDQYDQVILPCWGDDPLSAGSQNVKTGNQQQNVVTYTSSGGRVFATHLSYSWLLFPGATPFNTTATWVGDPTPGGMPDLEYTSGTAVIPSTGPADVTTMYAWMNALTWSGASMGTFPIDQERNNFSAVAAGTQAWMSVTGATPPIASGTSTFYPTAFPAVYSFDTPLTAPSASQCGKVVYSDFHVSVINGGGSDDQNDQFPSECTTTYMSPQEKALEYLIWDLASCVAPAGPTCIPKSCQDFGDNCGPIGDGCGGEIMSCGTCSSGCDTCGGGGTPSVCGGCCIAQTCAGQGIECGPAGDGCGLSLSCGTCPAGETCGGGGVHGKCGKIDAGPGCVPKTCAEQGLTCGPAGDGCGKEIQCGPCKAPATCGGGGKPGVCGPTCVPQTCKELGFNCGATGDGCGGELQCGTCSSPQTCGGGGMSSVCGGSSAK